MDYSQLAKAIVEKWAERDNITGLILCDKTAFQSGG